MRKQDRIQQQNRSNEQPEPKPRPQPAEQEQMRGNATTNQPPRPQREPGKLPLPD
jgi:hypothetical protein